MFRHLKTKQETHSSPKSEQTWKLEWNGDIYFNHCTSNSCGVATLISPGIDLTINILEKDDIGRFLAIFIHTKDQNSFAVYNIYAPK